MDTKFQTSFIPKKPVYEGPKRSTGSLFSAISVIVFVVAVIASIAVFGYQKILEGNIAKMQNDLASARNNLQPEVIKELSRANNRFESAQILLKSHTTISSFFNLLESLTLQAVRFNKFSYVLDDAGKITILMNGEARSYATVALQSKVFSENENFINPQFSDLDLNKDGNVVFTMKAGLNPKLISYASFIESISAPVSIEPVQTVALPTSTSTATTTP